MVTTGTAALVRSCDRVWEEAILPVLCDYIRIPNVSPAFDAGWAEAGHMDRAVELARQWCESRPIDGLTVEVVSLPDRTPVLLIDVAATGPTDDHDTVLLYGHLDKQPPMTDGWRPGLGPWEPVVDGGRLYGRGGADDGYATFASLTAIEAVQDTGLGRARCVVLIECSEESGSPDLPAYVEHLADRLGGPSLVVCLDSFCGDYERLWVTTSLRGLMNGRLRVDVLTEGVHSGSAGGVVPSSFRILRELLDRIEDAGTGRVLLPELWVDIPEGRRTEAEVAARSVGSSVGGRYPLVEGASTMWATTADRVLARTWEPAVAYVGASGLPSPDQAGNVLRPFTELALSFRLPPTAEAHRAAEALKSTLEADPPHGAHVEFRVGDVSPGWNAPPTAGWLADATDAASRELWGHAPAALGEGGSIPFMAMLGERFPDAQFLVTGVLGPGSNAHGPNEFLDLTTARRVTAATAHVLAAHAARGPRR